jgi:hypothetical protein
VATPLVSRLLLAIASSRLFEPLRNSQRPPAFTLCGATNHTMRVVLWPILTMRSV